MRDIAKAAKVATGLLLLLSEQEAIVAPTTTRCSAHMRRSSRRVKRQGRIRERLGTVMHSKLES